MEIQINGMSALNHDQNEGFRANNGMRNHIICRTDPDSANNNNEKQTNEIVLQEIERSIDLIIE